jgi:HPt (histidine-containing phosphotransfer) domain-containing protein
MNDYISKPLRLEELNSAIDKSRSRSGRTHLGAAPIPLIAAERILPNNGTAPITPEAIDTEALGKVREMLGENAQQLLAGIIDSYLDDTPSLLETMRAALAQADARMLQRVGHKLKSTSTILGAMTLAQLCDDLEDIGRSGSTAGCLERVLMIEAEYARVKVALELEQAIR